LFPRKNILEQIRFVKGISKYVNISENISQQTVDLTLYISTSTKYSLHEKLFTPQANRASKPWKSTSPKFILLAQKKIVIFQIWGQASVCYSSFIFFFFLLFHTIYLSSHTHYGYISSWTFWKSKYPACALLSDVITCMF